MRLGHINDHSTWLVRRRTVMLVTGFLSLLVLSAIHVTTGWLSPLWWPFLILALSWTCARWLSVEARLARPLAELGLGRESQPPRLLRAQCLTGHLELVYGYGITSNPDLIVKRQANLAHVLGRPVQVEVRTDGVHLKLGVQALGGSISYQAFYASDVPANMTLPLGIGQGTFGAIWADLTVLPHLLVGGSTGSGKTSWLRQMLVQLCVTQPCEMLTLVAVDLKATELTILNGLPHLLAPVATDEASVMSVLKHLAEELRERQQLFSAAGCIDLASWNEGTDRQRLPVVMLVVDELAELTSIGTKGRTSTRPAYRVLSTLARLGRAFGIHLLLATQRPDADVLPGQIKANVPATLAFRCRSEVNSRILLGESNSAAAHLPQLPGRAIWQHDTTEQIQGVYLSLADARAMLAPMVTATGQLTAKG